MKKIFLLTIVVCVLSSCRFDSDAEQSEIGRYKIVMGKSRIDTYIFDTKTGRIWQLTKYEDINFEPEVWQEMEFVDSAGSIDDVDVKDTRPYTSASELVRIYGLKKAVEKK